MSLVEVMIAAAMLLFAAVGLLPLFARTTLNNLSGADASEATQHARSELDHLLVLAFDDQRLDLDDPAPEQIVQSSTTGEGGEEMLIGDVFWDEGAAAQIPAATRRHCNLFDGSVPRTVDGRLDCIKLGDGGWVDGAGDAKGLVFWERKSVIRQYTYADISDGVIDPTGTQFLTLGHSQLLDRPLEGEAPRAAVHFREQAVELKSERAGGTVGDDLGPRSYRSRLVRTF